MSKREIIDFIMEINRGAKPEFLAQFSVSELDLYLEHLMELDLEEVTVAEAVPVLPSSSVVLKVTVVTPKGKVAGPSWVMVKVASTSSVAVAPRSRHVSSNPGVPSDGASRTHLMASIRLKGARRLS